MIDLMPDHLKIVRDILQRHVPKCEVRAFGSRVTGKAWRYSDLDLAIVGEQKLDWSVMASLREAFEASDLTIIIDWRSTSDRFKQIIIRDGYETIHQPSAASSK